MRIEFELNVQDLKKIQKLQKALMNKNFSFHSSMWAKLLWAMGALIWVVPTVLFVANLPSDMGLWLLYIALFPIVILAVLTFLQKRKYYRLAEPSFPPGLARSVAITNNGLEASAGQSNRFASWSAIMEIVEVPDYILFVLPLFRCLAVPARFFSDKDQLTAFVNEARAKMAGATNPNR